MKLTHPDSKLVIQAAPEQVDMYLSAGWVEGKPESKPDSEKS